jgi:hypothetical protein
MMRVMIVVSSHVCSVCAMKAQILGRRDDCFFLCPLCERPAWCRVQMQIYVARCVPNKARDARARSEVKR